ncbi:DedA family protein [Streptomyces nitrosporeus]|uniref:DedA family protein n=1 Tax=Streptomyces nitrosporeus TaxID=28894 RepID=A0A5J6FC82_9ACTN|nr:DedA family protein [Streptomyces nitrosporeus]QEU73791.1 DedA family protein [Streptomyces nitrosporeus]GGZ23440.1 hypothetical protein GCM10010327_62880 [Streptomyces nitrosporeus]
MNTLALGPSWLDPDYLLNTFGLPGLLLIVFAESGLLIGFFLPGDSLLFTTGLLVTTGDLKYPLWLVCVLVALAAIIGDQVGYLFGRKVGPSLFKRPDSRLFKQENVEKAHDFFEKYGPKSLVLARFVPIVRTFTPIIAGVSRMNYRSFIIFNILGGILWGVGVTLLGAALGKIDFVHENIEMILILIVLVSVLPIVVEFLRARSKAKKEGGTAERGADGSSADAPHAGDAPDAGHSHPAGRPGPYDGSQNLYDGSRNPYADGSQDPYAAGQGNGPHDPYGRPASPYDGPSYGGAPSGPYGNGPQGNGGSGGVPYGNGGNGNYGGDSGYGDAPYGGPRPGAYGNGPYAGGPQAPAPSPYGDGGHGDGGHGAPSQGSPYASPSQGAPYGGAQPGPYDGRPYAAGPYGGPQVSPYAGGPAGAPGDAYDTGRAAPYGGGHDTGRPYGDGQEEEPGRYGQQQDGPGQSGWQNGR